MGTIPFTQPKNAPQGGQTGMPGNTPVNTTAMNYNFLPSSTSGPQPFQRAAGPASSTQQDGTSIIGNTSLIPSAPTPNTGNPNTGVVPTPYTANNYQPAGDINNPFANYTGFNLGLNSASELQSMYGPLGTAMYYYLNNGAGYNPAVLNSLINQIQPQVQAGLAQLGNTAGMTGNRFGSAYQLGTSNFLSQVNQNELGMASGLYEQSQNTINNDMMSILGDAWQWKNNQASIWPLLLGSILPTLANKVPTLPGNNPQYPSTPPIIAPGQQAPPYPGPQQGPQAPAQQDPNTPSGPNTGASTGPIISVDPNTGQIITVPGVQPTNITYDPNTGTYGNQPPNIPISDPNNPLGGYPGSLGGFGGTNTSTGLTGQTYWDPNYGWVSSNTGSNIPGDYSNYGGGGYYDYGGGGYYDSGGSFSDYIP